MLKRQRYALLDSRSQGQDHEIARGKGKARTGIASHVGSCHICYYYKVKREHVFLFPACPRESHDLDRHRSAFFSNANLFTSRHFYQPVSFLLSSVRAGSQLPFKSQANAPKSVLAALRLGTPLCNGRCLSPASGIRLMVTRSDHSLEYTASSPSSPSGPHSRVY